MFLTDNFFTEQQKSDLLGSSYGAYAAGQQLKKRRDHSRQIHLREIEFKKHQQQLDQQAFDRKSLNVEWGALAFILFATLMSGPGMSFLRGEI